MAEAKQPVGQETKDSTADEVEEQVVVAWETHPSDRSHVREITKADWKSVGVDHPTVSWDRMNPRTKGQARVSKRAAEYLTEIEPGFKTVKDEDLAFDLRK